MERIETKSRSNQAAEASPIVLRVGPLTRLAFVPMIVRNPGDELASVKGTFVYQRKNKRDEWEPIDTLSLSTLRAGDQFKLDLSSEETLKLRKGLWDLANLVRNEGIPRGRQAFVRASPELARLLELGDADLAAIFTREPDAAVETLVRLLRWVGSASDLKGLSDGLATLSPQEFPSVSSLLNLAALKSAVAIWKANRENTSESYWQALLSRHSAVLSQIFAYPIVVIREQAYLGGKALDNMGGKLADFLVKAASTGALLIIEIKTPSTKLLGPEYRSGVRPISADLSGAIAQALQYRQSLVRNFDPLTRRETEPITLGDARCVVVAGDASCELTTADDRNSFELLRESLKGVVVLTFDELFARTESAVGLMEQQA